MNLSESEILQILKMVEESNFGELRLEMGDLKLQVRKNGFIASCTGTGPETFGAICAEKPASTPLPQEASAAAASEKPKHADVDREGIVAIKASMLGIVYRRPSPDMPPYVEVGSYVKADDTVCLIEIMKVFTAIRSDVSGYITDILVETNEMVEYGQPLFLVKPATEPSR